MERRQFLRLLLQGLVAAPAVLPRGTRAADAADKPPPVQFVFSQIRYRGGDWDPHPLGATPLLEELMLRTSIAASPTRREIGLEDPDLFAHPFLYITGKYDFDPFTTAETDTLRRFLSYGGFLLIDDALGQPGYGFDRSIRREMKRVFPESEFRRLPAGHASLRSYYLLRRIGGMKMVSPYVEGITVGSATPILYCQNNLGGAWEKDQLGKWVNPCNPGGEEQRRDAFHLGINVILYAMTENYKEDLIHVPFIRRRLSR
ncbi:MAG: DUF4159 domain-containing protein [Candidatus Binatia bacterium]